MPTSRRVSQTLDRQLTSPVLWTASVRRMVEDGIDTFVELGSGDVLCGLIKRIERDTTRLPVYDVETLEKNL